MKTGIENTILLIMFWNRKKEMLRCKSNQTDIGLGYWKLYNADERNQRFK